MTIHIYMQVKHSAYNDQSELCSIQVSVTQGQSYLQCVCYTRRYGDLRRLILAPAEGWWLLATWRDLWALQIPPLTPPPPVIDFEVTVKK